MGLLCEKTKVGCTTCVLPIVISSEFHTRQHRDEDHQINTPHFDESLTGFWSVEFGVDSRAITDPN